MFIQILFCLALAVSSLDAQCRNYMVQNGDSIASLAGNNTNLVNELTFANPNANKTVLIQGSTLCIPVQSLSSFSFCRNDSIIYAMKSNETTNSIVGSNSSLMTGLIIANRWMCPHMVNESYILCVPKATYAMYNLTQTPSPDEMKPVFYTVRANETIASLANYDPILIDALVKANSFTSASQALTGIYFI